ncbi:MAG: hemolysin III family protein [Clostridiales bacterium]|jgi:hemolysin III|nr:hemolysin III family protein [Clostridiales bacterium]
MAQEVTYVNYTVGEERFNWITHLIGAVLAVAALVISVVFAVTGGNVWAIVSCAVYGGTMILLYSMSTVYHALPKIPAKKVFRVIDHCSVFMLIAGTYTPYTLVTLRGVTDWIGWAVFGLVWAAAVFGIILNAISVEKFAKVSMACYIVMGWSIVLSLYTLIQGMELAGIILVITGGIFYTVGAVLYGVGKKIRYMHSVWHIFVILGSLFQFFSILFYVV